MEILILLVAILFAWVCAEMAKSRKRNTVLWAIAGFLFGIFAAIVLLLVGTAND